MLCADPGAAKLEHVLMSCDGPSRKADDVRFTYAEAMTDFRFYIPLAKAAEAAGYDAMTIADSIAYPYESDSNTRTHPTAIANSWTARSSSKRSS